MAYVGTPIDTTNQFQSLQGKRFSGDASTTAFTLDIAPSSVFDIEVFVENVRQDPNSAYSLSGTTLTFAAAPPSGTNNIYVVHQAKAVGTISPAAGTVNADSFDNTVISGHTALAAIPDTTDELLISDAGTIKRIDFSLLGNAPAFEATRSADQDISNNTYTKLQFNTETFDSDGAYDNSTNYRFTVPSGKAGKYYIYASGTLTANGQTQWNYGNISIYKNGSEYRNLISDHRANPVYRPYLAVHAIMDLSVSDYVEIYGRVSTVDGGAPGMQGTNANYFGGYRIIGL